VALPTGHCIAAHTNWWRVPPTSVYRLLQASDLITGFFIQAPYFLASRAPTLTYLVGATNDDIVSQASQLAFNLIQSVLFEGIAPGVSGPSAPPSDGTGPAARRRKERGGVASAGGRSVSGTLCAVLKAPTVAELGNLMHA
jgi:hypothetical protein